MGPDVGRPVMALELVPDSMSVYGWGWSDRSAPGGFVAKPEQIEALAEKFGPPDYPALRMGHGEKHGLMVRGALYTVVPCQMG